MVKGFILREVRRKRGYSEQLMGLHKFLKSYKQFNFWKTSPSELNPNHNSGPKKWGKWVECNELNLITHFQKLFFFFSDLHLMLTCTQGKVQFHWKGHTASDPDRYRSTTTKNKFKNKICSWKFLKLLELKLRSPFYFKSQT